MAWAAFRRAARVSPGYREVLRAHGVDPTRPPAWEDLPVVDRAAVFGDAPHDWVTGGVTAAAELVCSSGSTGGPLALGIVSAVDAERARRRIDAALAAIGAGGGSPTLLVNMLPMGISLPTRLATAATPSVHQEMALEILERHAGAFDRVVLAAEPLFLAEIARRWSAGGSPLREVWAFTGGEWVAEPLRRAIAADLLVDEPARVSVSFGAAELGLHVLHETPALVAARGALWDRPGLADDLGLTVPGGPDAPALLTWDPARVHVEERPAGPGDAPALLVTTLEQVALPLIRYDLGDVGRVLGAGEREALAGETGVPLDIPVVALSGRRRGLPARSGPPLRAEWVKERLFADPLLCAGLTGRFRLEGSGGGRVTLHVEARDGGAGCPGEDAALATLAAALSARAGSGVRAVRHRPGDYPFHPAGDWTHKPRYLSPEAGA